MFEREQKFKIERTPERLEKEQIAYIKFIGKKMEEAKLKGDSAETARLETAIGILKECTPEEIDAALNEANKIRGISDLD